MKEKLYEGKTLEEVEILAVQDLGVCKDDLYFDTLEENKINVLVDANPVKKGKDYLERFLQEANILGMVTRQMRDNIVEYSISTDDANGVLIGHDSRTLAALQYMTSLIVNQYFDRETESGLIVKVDVGDYRKRRDEKLEKLAIRIGREVAKTKTSVNLRFMNAYERKVIHNKLSDWHDVTTHSEGVEPHRYVVIEPRKREENSMNQTKVVEEASQVSPSTTRVEEDTVENIDTESIQK
jgi:spoIIIJ-associated protein